MAHRTMRYRTITSFVALIFMGACGQNEGEQDERAEVVQGALSSSFTTFANPGDPNGNPYQFVFGPDKNEYACFITRMGGPKTGTTSWATLIRNPGPTPEDPTGTRWYLRTDGRTSVTATCVKVSWFQASGAARLQRTTEADGTDGMAHARYSSASGGFSTASAYTWPANAASHLTGVFGYVQHPLTSASIQEGATGTTPTRVVATAGNHFLTVYSGSLFVGTPGTTSKAAYIGSPYTITYLGTNWKTTIMARTSEAVCFFTRIGGVLIGSEDVLKINTKIVDGVERWALEAKGESGGLINIEARCMARQQPS